MSLNLTKGQIEDLLSKEITKFYLNLLGTGPKESRTYILQDMIVVRLKGKLLPIEEKLLEGARGIELVKDIRKQLHEITTTGMSELIKSITHQHVITIHSDISTKTGEILQVFILETNFEQLLKTTNKS